MIELSDAEMDVLRKWLGKDQDGTQREPLFSQREIFKLGIEVGLRRDWAPFIARPHQHPEWRKP